MSMYKLYYDDSEVTTGKTGPSAIVNAEPLRTIRLAILGDYGVGKTSIIKRLCENRFLSTHKTTSCVSLHSTSLNVEDGNRKINLELYDTPSMDQYKENVGSFYQSCHGAIIVYDITEPYSFASIPKHVDSLRRSLPPNGEIFLIGAKSDLSDSRKIVFKDADVYAMKNNVSVFEISSKTNANFTQTFQRVSELVLERLEISAYDPSIMAIPTIPNVPNPTNVTVGTRKMNWSVICCWL